MSWMYYNKETEQTCLHGYISELSCFHAVVMAEQTWKIISKTSTKSGSSKTRQKQFFEDLTTLLNAQEEKRPVMEHQNDYILHIELSADETNAVISLQRKGNYEFVFRNEIISLKKIGNQNK